MSALLGCGGSLKLVFFHEMLRKRLLRWKDFLVLHFLDPYFVIDKLIYIYYNMISLDIQHLC